MFCQSMILIHIFPAEDCKSQTNTQTKAGRIALLVRLACRETGLAENKIYLSINFESLISFIHLCYGTGRSKTEIY